MGKGILYGIAALAGILIMVFVLRLAGLGMFSFFAPKEENVRREVFENTKSFTHGKIKELAKLYKEYQDSDSDDDRETIEVVISLDFADFDETKISNAKLRRFLIKTRGY